MTFDASLRALAVEAAKQWTDDHAEQLGTIIEAFGREVAARQREADARIAEEVGPWHIAEGESAAHAIAEAIRRPRSPEPEAP